MQVSQPDNSDQIHLIVNARDSYELTKLEEPDLPAIPATAEVLQRNNNPNTALSSLGEVAAPHADAQKFKGQLENAGFKSQSDCSTGIHLVHKGKLEGKDDISQACVGQDLALQQDDLVPTSRVSDVSRREVNSETMQLHAKLQSVLQRMMELERRLGAMRDNRFLRRERIQLGLEISVAGERGVSVSRLPYMMVLLPLIVVIFLGAYKYYAFSESA